MENDERIPCEFCNEMIQFHEYNVHVQQCISDTNYYNVESNQSAPSLTSTLRLRIVDEDLGMVDLNASSILSLINRISFDSNVTFAAESNASASNIRNFVFTLVAFSEPEEIEMTDFEFNSMITEVIGNVNTGVSDLTQVLSDGGSFDENDICPICRDTFTNIVSNGSNISTCVCSHMFCNNCITKWLSNHKKCPICMFDFEEHITKI